MSHVEMKEMAMSHVAIIVSPCPMSLALCGMYNLRIAHVALSSLSVKGPSSHICIRPSWIVFYVSFFSWEEHTQDISPQAASRTSEDTV